MAHKIDIRDLLEPQLDEIQSQAVAWAEANPIDLSEEAILGAARERTGLSDFGPDDFRRRLALLLDEWNDDTDMLQLNRGVLLAMAQRFASTRLLTMDLLKRHPEIHEEVVDRPIVVVGLPRSGTTHLLNLLAADSRLRSIPLWEGYEPIRNLKEPDAPGGVDPRYARAAEQWEQMQRVSPHIAAIHPLDPDHFHEDLELMCPDFATYHFEWMSRMPRWRDHHTSTDQTPHYEYMKTMFKVLQWTAGDSKPRRWVNKCPQHLEQLPVLKRVFPDATCVITYRDPVDVIQSAITALAYTERLRYHTVDAQGLLQYWTDRVDQLLRACVRDRDVWPESQRVDVPFEHFMRHDMDVVHEVQKKAGLPSNEKSDIEIRQFIDTHPRGKFGQLVYDLERDFGISRADLRKRFAYYFEAFPFLKVSA